MTPKRLGKPRRIRALLISGALVSATLGQAQIHDSKAVSDTVNKYCVTCHNAKLKTGGVVLDPATVDPGNPVTYAPISLSGLVIGFNIDRSLIDLGKAPPAVLEGARDAHRDIAVFNAAGALVVAEAARDLADGVRIAQRALDVGAARETLDRLVTVSNA